VYICDTRDALPTPWGTQMWFPNRKHQKSKELGLPQLWGTITLRTDLQLRWGPKQSCSLHRQLSNGMWMPSIDK